MNKLTKGSLATGAGLVLLLGGTGTFMSWSDSETVSGGQVVAGHLNVEPGTTPATWESTINGVTTPIASISSHQIVPGETLTYKTSVIVDAQGDNLQVTASLPASGIQPVDAMNSFDNALDALLSTPENSSVNVSTADVLTETAIGSGVYDVTEGTNAVAVTATIVFPSTADATVEDGRVNLENMTISLNQKTV